ncbi:MAG TPA: type II secretion system F family protein [Fimbriiglobus sp.]|nr:type II secretion system F family protein [Fimbriiglobus sp.]
MNSGLLLILTFAAGGLAVLGAISILSDLFLRDRSRLAKRLDDEFHRNRRDQIRSSPLFKDIGRLAAEAAAADDSGKTLRQRFVTLIEQSGLNLTPRKLMTHMALAGAGTGLLAGIVRPNVIVAAAGLLIGMAVPFGYVCLKRKARLDKMLRQLPDAFDLMARVIRAGQTMSQALQAVADEFDEPIAGEFSYCYEQQNLGLSPEVSLRDLARRTGLIEVKIFVLALLVQQQSGGNLAEILDKLAAVVRERFRIRAKIQALTAEGRMQAIVLLALPFVVMGMFMLMNERYADTVIRYPGLIVVMIVIEAVGAVLIRKIVNFDY